MEKVRFKAKIRGQARLSRRCRQCLNLKDKHFVERSNHAAIVVRAPNDIKDGGTHGCELADARGQSHWSLSLKIECNAAWEVAVPDDI